jgi:hypothetical protein
VYPKGAPPENYLMLMVISRKPPRILHFIRAGEVLTVTRIVPLYVEDGRTLGHRAYVQNDGSQPKAPKLMHRNFRTERRNHLAIAESVVIQINRAVGPAVKLQ